MDRDILISGFPPHWRAAQLVQATGVRFKSFEMVPDGALVRVGKSVAIRTCRCSSSPPLQSNPTLHTPGPESVTRLLGCNGQRCQGGILAVEDLERQAIGRVIRRFRTRPSPCLPLLAGAGLLPMGRALWLLLPLRPDGSQARQEPLRAPTPRCRA